MRHGVAAAVALFLGMTLTHGQSTYPTKFSRALVERAEIRQALTYIDANFDQQVTEWIRITEIPAPSGQEAARAAYIKGEFEKLGLPVTVDGIGNVTAMRRGAARRPTIVFAAHMDTVFPMGPDVTVKKRADGTMHAPGVFDNSASVTNMLQAARAMHAARIQTKGDVIFVATVQEEVGLKGMYYWVDHNKGAADMLVALDGGLGPVNYGALGIYWSRMKFTAEGAHTNNSRGRPNPALAAAQCITDIYTVPLPEATAPVSAVYNAGGIMSAIVQKCESAATAHRVQFTREIIQQSEAGGRPEQLSKARAHPIVQTAVDITRYLDVKVDAGQEALPIGSTDGNVGVLRGIPSISIGRARGGDTHTLQEWTDVESAKAGTKQIILLAAALTE